MNRYDRQIILPELGAEGQGLLSSKSVLCIGAGGLGSPALLYLAAAGLGRIGIVDDDDVDLTNLQRQVLFRETDCGEPKAQCAARVLSALNSACTIEAHTVRFSAQNAEALLADYDVVLDGTDNFASKFLINDACVKFAKPLVFASILGFDAQVSVFSAQHGPCYRCLYPHPPAGHVPNCAEAGVIGALAGVAGATQALEAIKMALGPDWCARHGLEPLIGRLWILDGRSLDTRRLTVHKRPDCAVCASNRDAIILAEYDAACVAPDHKAYRPHQVQAISAGALVIDVRERDEYERGSLAGAINWPLSRLEAASRASLDLSPESEIVVFCQSGVRSRQAVAKLTALGYRNVAHLDGSMIAWREVWRS